MTYNVFGGTLTLAKFQPHGAVRYHAAALWTGTVSKIRTIVCDNFETLRDRMPVSINH